MAGSRCAVGYYNREKLPARIQPPPPPPPNCTHTHRHKHASARTLAKHAVRLPCSRSASDVSGNMIGVGLIQLIDEQAAGGGGAVLPGTGEERTAEREGGEGGREVDGVSQSAA